MPFFLAADFFSYFFMWNKCVQNRAIVIVPFRKGEYGRKPEHESTNPPGLCRSECKLGCWSGLAILEGPLKGVNKLHERQISSLEEINITHTHGFQTQCKYIVSFRSKASFWHRNTQRYALTLQFTRANTHTRADQSKVPGSRPPR